MISDDRLAEIRERDANARARMFHTRMTAQERAHLHSDMDRRELLAEVDWLRAQASAVRGLANVWEAVPSQRLMDALDKDTGSQPVAP